MHSCNIFSLIVIKRFVTEFAVDCSTCNVLGVIKCVLYSVNPYLWWRAALCTEYRVQQRVWARTTEFIYWQRWNRVSVSAHSAGSYTATLLVMVIVVKGGGRAPPSLISQANFTLMMECIRQKAAVTTLCTLWFDETHKSARDDAKSVGSWWVH